MVKLADRFTAMPGSAIRAVMERVERLRGQGRSVVDFSIGRPNFDTPQVIKDATIRALQAGKVHYGPNAGLPRLRQKLAARLSASHGRSFDPAQVVVTNGAVEALYLAALSVLNPGDEALVPEPSWPYYVSICRLIGAVPVPVPTLAAADFQVTAERLTAAITPRTRAIFLNAPNNPTGRAQGNEALRLVAAIAAEHDLLIISDEVYDQIVINGNRPRSVATLPGMADRTAIINAFSKTYSMTGWRIGYLAVPESLSRAVTLAHTYINTSINTFTQDGAIAALDEAESEVADMVIAYNRRHDLIQERLTASPHVDCPPAAGGFFLFPRFKDFPDDVALAMRLLDEVQVAMVPGSSFGPSGAGHLRLSFACDLAECEDGVTRIEGWLRAQARS